VFLNFGTSNIVEYLIRAVQTVCHCYVNTSTLYLRSRWHLHYYLFRIEL